MARLTRSLTLKISTLFLLSLLCLASAKYIQAQDQSSIVSFEADVLPIFIAHCAECHVGDSAKNDLYVLERDSLMGYIDDASAADSSLWTDYLIAPSRKVDEDSLVMPPSGPLKTKDLAILKLWMDEGSPWPDKFATATDPALSSTDETTSVEQGSVTPTSVIAAVGYFHPAVVHFPISMLLVGGAFAMISYIGGGQNAKRFALWCLIIGAISAIGSTVAGWGFAIQRGYTPNLMKWSSAGMSEDNALMFRHQWLGIFTAAAASLFAILAIFSMRRARSGHIWRLGLIGCAMLVGITGHQGGEMVYGDILHKAFDQLGWNEPSATSSK